MDTENMVKGKKKFIEKFKMATDFIYKKSEQVIHWEIINED